MPPSLSGVHTLPFPMAKIISLTPKTLTPVLTRLLKPLFSGTFLAPTITSPSYSRPQWIAPITSCSWTRPHWIPPPFSQSRPLSTRAAVDRDSPTKKKRSSKTRAAVDADSPAKKKGSSKKSEHMKPAPKKSEPIEPPPLLPGCDFIIGWL